MINISPIVQQILNEPAISAFFMVRTAGGMRKTTYPADLEFNGETYINDGAIIGLELPKMTSVVDRQRFKLTFADTYLDFAAIAENSLIGQTVEVWMSFVDLSTNKPILNPVDVILIYKGAVDAPAHQLNTGDGSTMQFALDCASPMADLDRTRTYFASQDYADKNYPGDNSYEQIFQGSGPVSLRWGKA